jgi:alkylation response protein AidB-like acyl-CoA dehydrogenase
MNDINLFRMPSDALERARGLAGIIATHAETIDRTQRFPAPLLEAMHEARIFQMLVPRSVGGEQLMPSDYMRALEEVSRAEGSVGWCVSIANCNGLISAWMDLPIAREIWGGGRTTVAWGPPNESKAIAVPGGYRISGRWDFASGCRHSLWMGAHGTVVEPDGRLRLNRYGRPAIKSWLFPATSATILDGWNPIGLRGTASNSYQLNDLFVPEEYTSTREDHDLRRERGPLYAIPQQTMYSVGIASVALGIARGMLEEFLTLANNKAPRGMPRLADSGVIQSEVARAEAKLGASRAYLAETLDSVCARADDIAPIDIPERARIRLAASHAITNAAAVGDYVYKAAGVDAIFPGSPFERRFRDLHTVTQQIQSRDAHFESCGKVLLGNIPQTFV